MASYSVGSDLFIPSEFAHLYGVAGAGFEGTDHLTHTDSSVLSDQTEPLTVPYLVDNTYSQVDQTFESEPQASYANQQLQLIQNQNGT